MTKRKITTLLATGLTLAIMPSLVAAKDSITIAAWGGASQEAQRKAMFNLIEEKLGITVLEDTTSGIKDVRLQVASGSPTWDLVHQGNYSCIILDKEGKLEPLDESVLGITGIPDEMKGKGWVANFVYSTVLAWNTDTLGDNPPTEWADMWDTEKFPGRRAMRRDPAYSLEAALLADGVPMNELYPLDVDRAFAKLESLKDSVSVWWSSGAQSAQILQDGEADMVGIWNGRAQALQEEGGPVEITFNQQIILTDCWVIPKGAPNKDLAMQALAIMSSAEAQAELTKYINYGPSNLDAFELGLIPEEVAKGLPNYPDNRSKGFLLDANYWAENLDELTQRFDFFIQE